MKILRARAQAVAEVSIFEPLEAERQVYDELCSAVAQLNG